MEKEECPFCGIIAGKIPARRVYEDEHAIAVLDINPAGPGHMLLIPKRHVRIIAELPIAETMHLGLLCKRLAFGALRAMPAQGATVILPQGEAAGQGVPHLFIHIIPRREQDGLRPISLPQQPFSMQDLNDVKAMLVRGITQVVEGDA